MFLCICQNSFLNRIVVTSPCFRLGQFLCTYHHSDIKMYSAISVIFHIPHRPLSEKIVMFSHRWCFPKAISSFPLVAICVFNSCWLSKTSACSACWDMTSFIKTPQKTTTTNPFFPSFFFLSFKHSAQHWIPASFCQRYLAWSLSHSDSWDISKLRLSATCAFYFRLCKNYVMTPGKIYPPTSWEKKDGSWFKLVSTLPWHQVRTHLADKHIYLYGSDTKRSMKSPWAVDGPPQGAIPPAHWLYF